MRLKGGDSVKKNQPRKRKKSILLRVAIVAFSVYVVVSIVQVQLQLNSAQSKLDKLDSQIRAQEETNKVLQDRADGELAEYLEQQARKNGMAKPGESIFIEIPHD